MFTGIVLGMIQTILGHPFDTLKTGIQLHNCKTYPLLQHIIKNEGVVGLYKGSLMPFTFSVINNCYLFNGFEYLVSKSYSNQISGFILGFVSSFFMSPIEMLKCHIQSSKKHVTYIQILNQLRNQKISLYKGFYYTLLRETIGCTSYFYLFFLLEKNFTGYTALNGGLTGSISWILTYPIDTIKTRYQVDGIISYKNLYKGFSLMLARSFIVNSAIFYYYQNCVKRNKQSKNE